MQPQLRFTVAFDEGDREDIVFFGNYFRLAHRALEQWLPTVGIPWADWFKHKNYGVPLRHVEAEYLAPLKPGDVFDVAIKVAKLGESSVVFEYEFSREGQPIARLKTAHVFVSRPEMGKMSLPSDIRARLSAPMV